MEVGERRMTMLSTMEKMCPCIFPLHHDFSLLNFCFLHRSGGVWTCPYAMESIATLNWAMGKTGYYPKGYIPPAAIMKTREERALEPVRDPEEVFKEMENSTFGEDMPQCVRDRLDFM